MIVTEVQGRETPRVVFRPEAPMNPASVMKLVTTYSALEQLGSAFTWTTSVYTDGQIRNGTLAGNLYIKGQGDPKMVVERLWLLMRRIQGLGIRHISGDIVLDRSYFDATERDPGSFDGEPLRPYNVAPDALLLNYKSVVLTFVPDAASGVVQISSEPPLAAVNIPSTVALTATQGGQVSTQAACGDWRAGLAADFSDPNQIRFAGSYPASCGERTWPVAYSDPASFASRAVLGMWRQLNGQLDGKVRDGKVPAGMRPAFEVQSPALSEVIRDINKYSNNTMAQQLFLTLGSSGRPNDPGTFASARESVNAWWKQRFGVVDGPVLDNGSGLSRSERISAQSLSRMLQAAWASPVMPELMSSLPVTGTDGTLKRRTAATGAAHLKTGSLRDVVAIAGYVLGASGKRYVVVAIVNHANAGGARPALDALTEWTARDL